MNALVIDTCTERGLFALFHKGFLLYRKELPVGLQNAQLLLSELARALKEFSFDLRGLDYIASGIGPGSYTGIRVGAIAAKSLAFSLQIPLIGIPTLDAFVPDEEGSYAVLIDAKISGAYFQTGRKQEGLVHCDSPRVCPLQETAFRLKEIPLILTPQSTQLKQKLASLDHPLDPLLQPRWLEIPPCPLQMYSLSLKKYLSHSYSLDSSLPSLYSGGFAP